MNKPSLQCPTCAKKMIWDSNNPFRPFCCERCKLIDLGAWANEEYQIPENKSASDFSSGSEEEHPDRDESINSTMH